MPFDPFANNIDSAISPAQYCFSISPSDSADLSRATKAIYVGTGGDVVLQSVAGEQNVTFRNVPDGSILDVRVRAVRATGTTATDIVGLS